MLLCIKFIFLVYDAARIGPLRKRLFFLDAVVKGRSACLIHPRQIKRQRFYFSHVILF
jgi:hypothetical protein